MIVWKYEDIKNTKDTICEQEYERHTNSDNIEILEVRLNCTFKVII